MDNHKTVARFPGRTRDFNLLQCPDKFWGPPGVLFNGNSL